MTATEPRHRVPEGAESASDAENAEGAHDADGAEDAGQPSTASIDRALDELQRGERAWARMTLSGRIRVLRELADSVHLAAPLWVETAARIKGLEPDAHYIGEEWISGPYALLDALDALTTTLAAIARGASPIEHAAFGTAPGGRVTVPVLPRTALQGVLFHGFRADVWLEPGVTASEAAAAAGLGQLIPTETGGVGLVLGAGNITSIPPLDVLTELFAHNRVAVLKLNPVMDDLLPVYQAALSPLIARGLLRIVTGGSAIGTTLAHHPSVSHVHITGSAATHDAIVWGTGEDAADHRAAGTPLLQAPITSELGGVGPIIVVPGRWSAADLQYQAEHVVTQRLHNSGYNCIAGQVLVLSRDWPQRQRFVDEVRAALARTPARTPWYPGSEQRSAAASARYPQAEETDGRLLIEVDSDDSESMLQTEYFAPVLGIVDLPGEGQAFLDAAVDAANTDFAGTLGVNIFIAPPELEHLGDGFEQAIARLRYGTIAINTWTAVGFLTAAAPWGAYPGHTLDDVQSGIGVVHNALLLDRVERTVVRGPFRPFPRSVLHGEFALFPKPPWFVTARSAALTGRRLTDFAARPSWFGLPAVFAAAFRA
ncbi:MAG: hypothetical protein RI885_680 [Actinomycetota bacterium]